MKKVLVVVIISIICIAFCAGCSNDIGDGRDILLDGVVYKRAVIPNYNMTLSEDNKIYVGDYIETYDYGQQLPWEVFAINEQRNLLLSAHAIWLKPGYELPDEYGANFSQVDYVISEGILDDYKEDSTYLTTFTDEVKLENIISSQSSELENVEVFGDIRFWYTDHQDINIVLPLCKSGDKYYLNVREDTKGDPVYFAINEQYVQLFTSAL